MPLYNRILLPVNPFCAAARAHTRAHTPVEASANLPTPFHSAFPPSVLKQGVESSFTPSGDELEHCCSACMFALMCYASLQSLQDDSKGQITSFLCSFFFFNYFSSLALSI